MLLLLLEDSALPEVPASKVKAFRPPITKTLLLLRVCVHALKKNGLHPGFHISQPSRTPHAACL